MQKQQGAALIIVLVLLSVSLVIGMSGMNAALVDERLAGNYRASVQAQMNSDSMMSEIHSSMVGDLGENFNKLQSDMGEEKEKIYRWDEITALLEFTSTFDNTNKLKVKVKIEGEEVIVTTQDDGTNNNAVRETVAIYRKGSGGTGSGGDSGGGSNDNDSNSGDGSLSPFEAPVVGCEGVTSGSGSTISSYRSSDDPWDKDQPEIYADPLVRTTSNGADVELTGGGQVHGGVEAIGKIYINSVSVHGNVIANGNVTSQNSQNYPVSGNIESMQDIIINNTTKVLGHVKAEGEVRTTQWDFSVGESIYAGGRIVSPRNDPADHLVNGNRDQFFPYTSPGLTQLEPQGCDVFDFSGNDLTQEMARYQSELGSQGSITVGSYPNNEWRITPEKIERYDETWNVRNWVEYARSQENFLLADKAAFYRLENLKFAGSPVLRISGGDVVLVIDGDFITGNGGNNINGSVVIDDDSSLTVFVGGKVSLGSNVKMPVTQTFSSSDRPTFSIFSSYESDGVGVNVDGGGRVVANIYAPYTKASINSGGNLFGSVRAKFVDVSGDGAIVYPSNSSPETGNGGGWQLVGWQ